jgi:hypothetical protein
MANDANGITDLSGSKIKQQLAGEKKPGMNTEKNGTNDP